MHATSLCDDLIPTARRVPIGERLFAGLRGVLVVCGALLATAGAGHARQEQEYSIRLIEALPGHMGSVASAINESSTVVGTSDTVTGYVWSLGRARPLTPTGGSARSRAEGVGAAGEIVGAALTAGESHATVWSHVAEGDRYDLGTGPGDSQSLAEAINIAGLVVGCSDDQVFFKPAVYTPTARGFVAATLPMTPGHLLGAALDVNDDGRIVGFTSQWGTPVAARWDLVGGLWRLTSLPNLAPAGGTEAVAVDRVGRVLGHAQDENGDWRMAVWVEDTLHVLEPDAPGQVFAYGMSPGGEAVGTLVKSDDSRHAVRHEGLDAPDGALVELYPLIPPGSGWDELRVATDVNSRGEIVGYGVIDGYLQSFIATPIRRRLITEDTLVRGAATRVAVTGCEPGAIVDLYLAEGGGETPLAGAVQSLDLDQPSWVGAAKAGTDGRAHLKLTVPLDLGGETLWLQARDRDAGEVTDVVTRGVR